MKPRWIIAMVPLTLAIAGGALLFFWPDSAQTALEETRRALRQQGFKIDLKEFDLSAPTEFRARAAALTNADLTVAGLSSTEYARRAVLGQVRPDFMAAVGSSAAVVVWKQEKLPPDPNPYSWMPRDQAGEDLWPALHDILGENRAVLDTACAATLSGPIRFDLVASHGTGMLLRHVAALRSLAQLLGTRAVLELHYGNKDAAWTNVLASTRLVTAWDPEPVAVSQLVRFGCSAIAYNTTWQALQAGGWADDRLADLQHEWESVEFFKRLPETAAFSRASIVATCQRERQKPLPPSLLLREIWTSPRNAWYGFIARWRRISYRHHGSYEDERTLLLHYRDRELELRRAVPAPTWLEMRQLPGVTNLIQFQSKYPSRVSTLINLGQISLGFAGRGQSLLSRAAEAEARRRLLITAIALERYRSRHGSYPPTLQELTPDLLQHAAIDFMDGQPLRYHLTEDGHFVLYSVGLDCVDNGGEMRQPRRQGQPYQGPPDFGFPQGPDLVWPRAASAAEITAHRQEEQRQAELQKAAMEESRAEAQEQAEAERQATIEKLLAEAAARKAAPEGSSQANAAEPAFQGQPLSLLLRNNRTAGINSLTLDGMLTARQITDGEYDGTAVFEVPVSYDAATNYGRIHLLVDGGLDQRTRGEEGERQTCERATNGNCQLGWTSTYDPPGRHAIQAEFIATKEENKEETARKVKGPAVPFLSTNLCQFSAAYDFFDTNGATLYAKLPESNGVCVIELTSPTGQHLKTLNGTTSNGVVKVHWDLIDERGSRYTNIAFDSVFQVTLPGSGRSQTLKGP
jgi:hypothetical protein